MGYKDTIKYTNDVKSVKLVEKNRGAKHYKKWGKGKLKVINVKNRALPPQ